MSYHRRYVRKKNRQKERIKILIIVSVIVLVAVLIGVGVGFVLLNSNYIEDHTATPDNAIFATTSKIEGEKETSNLDKKIKSKAKNNTVQHTEENTNATENNEKASNKNSTKVLREIGIDAEEYDFEQLVVVQSSETTAKISFFQKNKGVWKYAKKLSSVDGFVGIQGVSDQASEYSKYTPSGLYSLGTAFGICDNPGTKMEYFNVTSNSYWVDDPNSQYYNQHVEGLDNADWQSAEHLIDCNPEYNYAVFIEYNTNPIVAGNGSAFFVHVGYEPTAGCVSMAEDSMIQMLRWLNPKKAPHILII